MNILKLFSFLFLLFATAFAAYNGAEWDEYRIPGGCLTPLQVNVPDVGDLTLYSIGDEGRRQKHTDDMKALFAIPEILKTWGGINATEHTDAEMNGMIDRWFNRAQRGLPSWRLVYNGNDLIGVVASYVGLYKGSPYDGGAELAACTHPDYWRRGVAKSVAAAYTQSDLLGCPKFQYLWASADPANEASIQGVKQRGFVDWTDFDPGDEAFPGYGRKNRIFFKAGRDRIEAFLAPAN